MLILYYTEGCHLCDLAQQQLALWPNLTFKHVDIAVSDALIEEFGVKIPVIKNLSTGDELAWPFNAHILNDWLIRQQLGN